MLLAVYILVMRCHGTIEIVSVAELIIVSFL